MFTDLALQKTLDDYIASRDKIIDLYKEIYLRFDLIRKEADSVGHYILGYKMTPDYSLERCTKELDKRFWELCFDKAGFYQVIDSEGKGELLNQLERNTPEFNQENIRSTFLSLYNKSDEMFKRGIVNIFRRMSNSYKTNSKEAFKIGRKNILNYIFTTYYAGNLRINYGKESIVNDIDRVVKILDGEKHNPRELEMKINACLAEGNSIFEDDYYKIKAFKNGNCHLEFKKEGVLNKINKLISEYYNGNALADAR